MIITWNVHDMSVRENIKAQVRRIVGKVVGEGWGVVCITEISGDCEGVVWLGGDESRVVSIHGKSSGVLLRNNTLKKWVEEEQRKGMSERLECGSVWG